MSEIPLLIQFQEDMQRDLETAWERVEQVKQQIDELVTHSDDWDFFNRTYQEHLAQINEQRRRKEVERDELLMRVRNRNMSASVSMDFDDEGDMLLGMDKSDNAAKTDDNDSDIPAIAFDDLDDDDTNSDASRTTAFEFDDPDLLDDDGSADNQPDTPANESTPRRRKATVAQHFRRLYFSYTTQDAANTDYAERMQLISEMIDDEALDEIDLITRLPFDPVWQDPLVGQQSERNESDPERIYRFRLWAQLLDVGLERMTTRVANIRRSDLYDDFERWRQTSDRDTISEFLRPISDMRNTELDQLEEQIRSLRRQLDEGNDD